MHMTITFNSVTLKNTQTEPQKYISFSTFIKYKKKIEITFFYFLENYSWRVRNSTNKNFWPKEMDRHKIENSYTHCILISNNTLLKIFEGTPKYFHR